MSQVMENIDVDVPVAEAYNQWTQFESFPHFLSFIESHGAEGGWRGSDVAQLQCSGP